MNRRRVIGVAVAIILALVGMVGIVAYVDGAEERAASGEQVAEVFLVTRRVPPGTAGEDIGRYIELDTVPQKLVTRGTVGRVEDVEGLVAEVEILPGEVLSINRFVEPTVFERDANRVVDIPPGLQEVTLALTPERAGGSLLVPGDTVGVIMSFEPFDITSEVPVEVDGIVVPPNGSTPNTTTVAIHKLLVTNVQLEQVPQVVEREGIGDEDDEEVRLVPSGNLLVTLAVDTATAERLVFGAEFGLIWLSNEGPDAIEAPTLIQTRGTVYQDVVPLDEPDEDDPDAADAAAGDPAADEDDDQ